MTAPSAKGNAVYRDHEPGIPEDVYALQPPRRALDGELLPHRITVHRNANPIGLRMPTQIESVTFELPATARAYAIANLTNPIGERICLMRHTDGETWSAREPLRFEPARLRGESSDIAIDEAAWFRLDAPVVGYASEYEPEHPAKFREMLRDARGTRSHDQLKTFVMCWILEPSYPRVDISTVLGIVEREKGWRE